MSAENVEIVREIYARFNRRDYEGMWELMTPGMEFRMRNWVGPEKQRFFGREGAAEYYRDAFATFANFIMEPVTLVDCGDQVAAELVDTGEGKTSGVEVEFRICGLWTLAGGRATRFEIFDTLEEALAAASG